MFVETIRSAGLAHNSYLFGGDGEAAVVDPRRDCRVYLERAAAREAEITCILETHRNEDYLVGSPELSARTGATVHHGARLDFGYGSPAREGDVLGVGPLELAVLETPGHTAESLSFVLRDGNRPFAVFTGDALFAGSVGRVDLMSEDRSANAAALWDSLHHAILALPDGTVVLPAHGAGSVCGVGIRDLPFTTIGHERATNPLLAMGREEFVAAKSAELTYRPPYFRRMEELNRAGPPGPPERWLLRPLGASELARMQVVDIRSPTAFGAGHVPGSLSLWREGLSSFAGWVLDYDRPIALVDDFNLDLDRVAARFLRLGYDNLAGYLGGGFGAWFRGGRPIARFPVWTVQDLRGRLEEVTVLDVRDGGHRVQQGAIPGSVHVYVGQLASRLDEVPRGRPIAVHCDVGYKGSLAASILANAGIGPVANVLGGFAAWKNAGFPVETGGA